MPNEGTGSLPRILAIAERISRSGARPVLYNLIIFVLLITIGGSFWASLPPDKRHA